MKILKFATIMIFLMSVAACLLGCGPEAPKTITVTPAQAVIPPQTTQQFQAFGNYPGEGDKVDDITTKVDWNSSNPAVATVNSNGLATAIAVGTTTITANLGATKGTATLTVTSATLTSIFVTPANSSLPAQIPQQFTATGTYSDSTAHDVTSLVTWNSSNTVVATISSSGLVTPVAVGTTTITATTGGISGNTNLTVTSATLSSIAVAPADINLAVQLTQQFVATGTFSDSTTHDLTSLVAWNSSAPTVAAISATGLATAVAQGKTTITATLGGISGTTTITVTSGMLTSISITPPTPSIKVGTTQPFAVTGTFSDGSSSDITSLVAWNSSNTSVASINSNGLATAVAVGTTTISAIVAGISGTATLTVTQ